MTKPKKRAIDQVEDEDPQVERGPKTFLRTRYCATCNKDEEAILEIREYARRDVYIYRLKCGRVLSDTPIPEHISKQRLSRFETYTAGGILWRIFKAEWVLVPMNLMDRQWYFEPEFYHLRDPYSDSYRNKEMAEQAILNSLELLQKENVVAMPEEKGHATSGNRILVRLTKTAGAAMVRIKERGEAHWEPAEIQFWGRDVGVTSDSILNALKTLRMPGIPDRAGALLWLLEAVKKGLLNVFAEEWNKSLEKVFAQRSADHGRLFAALAKFAAHYLDATKRDIKLFLWPLTCELYTSTVDPSMSKLVGARLIGRYEKAVKDLKVEVPAELEGRICQGQDFLTIIAIDQFVSLTDAEESDLPDAVCRFLIKRAATQISPAALAGVNSESNEDPAPLAARRLLTSLGMMWLVKAHEPVREECAQLAASGYSCLSFLQKAFALERVLLPDALVKRAGVGR